MKRSNALKYQKKQRVEKLEVIADNISRKFYAVNLFTLKFHIMDHISNNKGFCDQQFEILSLVYKFLIDRLVKAELFLFNTICSKFYNIQPLYESFLQKQFFRERSFLIDKVHGIFRS